MTEPDVPALHGATIVCFASIDWAFNWQIPQEIALGLARRGNRVLFVENTGVRRLALRDISRVGSRVRNIVAARGRVRRVDECLDVYSPVIAPFPYSVTARRLNRAAILAVTREWIGPTRDTPVIFLTFLPTPLARDVARGIDPALVVYYCADRFAESSRSARQVLEYERALLSEADVVFTTSHGLLRSAADFASRPVLLPAGVRCDLFEKARAERGAADTSHAVARRPTVGFVGTLRSEVDLRLLAAAARLAPELQFVLVGPVTVGVDALRACANVTIVGPVTHSAAVNHMVSFDAGVLPYVHNSFTRDLMPMKLKEYLAAGLPTVSTGLREVRRFVEAHGPVIEIAEDTSTFVAAVRRAVEDRDEARRRRRLDIARQYDWDRQLSTFSCVLSARLSRRQRTEPVRG